MCRKDSVGSYRSHIWLSTAVPTVLVHACRSTYCISRYSHACCRSELVPCTGTVDRCTVGSYCIDLYRYSTMYSTCMRMGIKCRILWENVWRALKHRTIFFSTDLLNKRFARLHDRRRVVQDRHQKLYIPIPHARATLRFSIRL